MPMPLDAAAVDLFCGAGGLTFGLESAGLRVVAGVDLDPACKFPLEQNTGATFYEKDVSDLTEDDLKAWFGEAGFALIEAKKVMTRTPERPKSRERPAIYII